MDFNELRSLLSELSLGQRRLEDAMRDVRTDIVGLASNGSFPTTTSAIISTGANLMENLEKTFNPSSADDTLRNSPPGEASIGTSSHPFSHPFKNATVARAQSFDGMATEALQKAKFALNKAEAERESMAHNISWRDFVKSSKFDAMSLAVIFVNALVMGWQVNYAAKQHKAPPLETTMDTIFTAWFFFELIVRAWALSPKGYLLGPGFVWAWFDCAIVSLSVVDVSVGFIIGTHTTTSLISSLRVLRLARVMRITKIIRGIRALRELRLLLEGIIQSFLAVGWTVIATVFVTYVTSVVIMFIIEKHLLHPIDAADFEPEQQWCADGSSHYLQYFGGLKESIVTLFQVMTGDSWSSAIMRPMLCEYPNIVWLFCSYFCFTAFGLLNIVTGIFVDQVTSTAANDQEVINEKEQLGKTQTGELLKSIMGHMNTENNGLLSHENYQAVINNPEVQDVLSSFEIDVEDADNLYMVLDTDCTGTIPIHDFVEGCMKLRGAPSHSDIIFSAARNTKAYRQIRADLARIASMVSVKSMLHVKCAQW